MQSRSTPAGATLSAREYRLTLARISAALSKSDRIVLGHFRRAAIELKPDGSEVTVADRRAELALRREIRASWPGDAVMGEEYGGELTAGRCWLLDPIDGTSSYVLGIPTFGTLISLLIEGEPVFGCIHLSALGETTYAARGHGCWLKRTGSSAPRVYVGPPRRLHDAQIGLTSFKRSDLARQSGDLRLSRLLQRVGRVRLVGDCVQYALLCRGALDAGIDPKMNPWDIGALAPCVLEAGGSLSDLGGNMRRVVERTSLVAASSDSLRRAICREVSGS